MLRKIQFFPLALVMIGNLRLELMSMDAYTVLYGKEGAYYCVPVMSTV